MRWEVWSPYIQESFEPGVKTKSFRGKRFRESLLRSWRGGGPFGVVS